MGLILIMLAFLTSLLLLLMYKAMWYNQLTCPEGFVLKVDATAQPPTSTIAAQGPFIQVAGMIIIDYIIDIIY